MEEKDLIRKMRQLKIYDKDVKEVFCFSTGPGGQNVNKAATCVCLEHIPTGIRVKFQRHRTQYQNRLAARVLLVEKIGKMILEKDFQEKALKSLKFRQNRKRPTVLKEEILKDKHFHSEKKSSRRKVALGNGELDE